MGDPPGCQYLGCARRVPAGAVLGKRHGHHAHAAVRAWSEAMPGEGLAMRLVSLTVAALVQCFEWDVGEGDTIGMAEGGGLTMPMAAAPGVCQERALCFHLMGCGLRSAERFL
ncbi:hypothetical protein VPH35_005470 [Triticum aestivum]